MSDNLTVLKKARELIAEKSRWTKRIEQRSINGVPVQWCAGGAVRFIVKQENCEDQWVPARAALRASLPLGYRNLAGFNDAPTTSHADVLALFDRAIADLELA